MNRLFSSLALILCLAIPVIAIAGSHTETFDGGMTTWTFGTVDDVVMPTGGNPGAWHNSPNLNTFIPTFRCDYDEENFTGNYEERGVIRIAGDFITNSKMFSGTAYYPFALLLRSGKGTTDHADDDYLYFVDDNIWIPQIGDGFVHYEFQIPLGIDEANLPFGWYGGSYFGNGQLRDGVTVSDVLQNVTRVEFWYCHPDWFVASDWYDVGADNVTIEWDEAAVSTEDSSWGSVKALFNK